MTEKNHSDKFADLRRRAEQAMRGQSINLGELTPEEVQRLFHELQVHQVELEMQNDELRRSEHRYSDLYDSSPVGYVTHDEQGMILQVNLTGAAMLGAERDDLIKTPLPLFIAGDGQDAFYLHCKRAFASKTRQTTELEMVKKGARGARFWARLESIVVPGYEGADHCRTTISDVSERVRAEKALRESEEQFRQLSEASFEAVAIHEEGVLFEANEQFCEMFGYEKEELLGKQVIPLTIAPESIKLLESKIFSGSLETYEVIGLKKDGTKFPIEIRAREIDYQGRTARVGVIRDITERVQAEAVRRQTEEALHRRTSQLEALREVGLEIAAQLDLDALLHSIVVRATELLEGDTGYVVLYRPERDVMELVVTTGDAPIPADMTYPREHGLAGKIWETGKAMIVGNYQRWDDRVASLDDFPNVAVVGAPIHWGLADPGGEIKGILFVADDVSRVFSQADADLLSLFAIQAAIAIENAQLYEQAQQDAKTKAVLLRQVNHRVRNNLTALIGLLTIERYRAEAEGLLDYQSLLNNLGNRIHGLASVHSMLSESEWTPLSLYKLVVQIARLSSQSLPRGKHVSIEVAHSPVRVTPDQAHNLAVVINELATNTVKYALREQDMVNIDVRIEFDGDIITLIFRNDGPDYPPEVLRMERIGTGLELLQNIVRQSLRGELLLRNDGGAVTEIRFKVRAT